MDTVTLPEKSSVLLEEGVLDRPRSQNRPWAAPPLGLAVLALAREWWESGSRATQNAFGHNSKYDRGHELQGRLTFTSWQLLICSVSDPPLSLGAARSRFSDDERLVELQTPNLTVQRGDPILQRWRMELSSKWFGLFPPQSVSSLLDARLIDASSIYQTIATANSRLDLTSFPNAGQLPIDIDRLPVKLESTGLERSNEPAVSKPPSSFPRQDRPCQKSAPVDQTQRPRGIAGEKRVAEECVPDLLALGMHLHRSAALGQSIGKDYRLCHAQARIHKNPSTKPT